MTKHNDEIKRVLNEYCARMGIPRAVFDMDWLLDETQVAALELLYEKIDAAVMKEDVIMPESLPGAGKRYGDLTAQEEELLTALNREYDELLGIGDDDPTRKELATARIERLKVRPPDS